MSDAITQMRLSMRLDKYLSDHSGKDVRKDTPYAEEWDTAWHKADTARAASNLTPELVDDVRRALNKCCI